MVERQYVEEEFTKAEQALADAERLLEGGSDEGAVNRLYYACFHAAQTALYAHDVRPESPGAVRRQFGRELVLEDKATREQGRLLTTLADLRQQADYGYEPIEEDVGALYEQVSSFLDAMEAHVDAADDS